MANHRFWHMTNDIRFLEGVPWETVDHVDMDFRDMESRMAFLVAFCRAGRRLNITRGHVEILWLPPFPEVNLIFLRGAVATKAMADVIECLVPDEVQRIPARYKGDGSRYEMLNFTTSLDCLDEEKSDVRYHHRVKGVKIALPHGVIDPSKVGKSQVFRLSELLPWLIVTDAFRLELLRHGVVGPQFVPLETSDD